MKRLLTLCLLLLSLNTVAQRQALRPILWFGPSNNVKVAGICFSPVVYRIPHNTTVNGINIEIIGIPALLAIMPFNPAERFDSLAVRNEYNVNGISISPYGLIHPGTVNGLAISPWLMYIDQVNGMHISMLGCITHRHNGFALGMLSNTTVEMNGVQLAVFNKSKRMKGVQIGLLNNAANFKGIQIGLWNVNNERKLPFINWGTGKEKRKEPHQKKKPVD